MDGQWQEQNIAKMSDHFPLQPYFNSNKKGQQQIKTALGKEAGDIDSTKKEEGKETNYDKSKCLKQVKQSRS